MTNRKRLPQAPSEPLPELAEFLAPFRVKFAFDRSFRSLARYLTGLLTEQPQKNCDTQQEYLRGFPKHADQEQILRQLAADQVLQRGRSEKSKMRVLIIA